MPPRGLINFLDLEYQNPHDQSKVIAVEQDCLQLIDLKKKEIRKIKIKNDSKSIEQLRDQGSIIDFTKEWLFKMAMSKTGGKSGCQIVRDFQLHPFDYS